MLLRKGLTQQCQYQNQFYKFIGCLCFCNVFKDILQNMHKQTKLPNCVPSPLSFPQWYLHFSMVFTWFSDGTTDPKQTITQPKASLQPLRVGSRSFTFVLFCQPFKKQQRSRKQEFKKPEKQKTNKTQDCTPQGGSRGRELGLVIFFGFV